MTQKDKELLIKDICTRLPYMPKIKIIYQQQGIKGTDEGNVSCDAIEHIVNDLRNGVITHMQIYLRPMSSMTEEERKEYHKVIIESQNCSFENNESATTMVNDWLLFKGFDVRGLIPKGLAIEVTKENNIHI